MSTLRESTLESNQYELEALLSDRFAITWRQMVVVGLVCTVLVLISLVPLTSHTTWLLASRGEAILSTGHLPNADVTQTLAQGMSVRETSWLSSVFWALVARRSLEAVSWATTILGGISLTIVAVAMGLRTNNSMLTLCGIAWFSLMAWSCLTTGSASLLAFPLWIGLVLLNTRSASPPSVARSLASVALIALWANFDSSVFVGLGFLVLQAAGRSLELVQENRGNLFHNREFQWMAVTLELALLATLLTPIGTGLWAEVFGSFSVSGVPFTLLSISGLGCLLAAIALAIVLRKQEGRLPYAELTVIAGFGLWCLVSASNIVWFAPLGALILIPRLQTSLGISADPTVKFESVGEDGEPKPQVLKFAYTLTAILLCWIAFALSPLSQGLLGRQPRSIVQLFDSSTPVAAAKYLRENPVEGLVYAPAAWGDLLQSHQAARATVFATTAMEHLPQQAKYDYGKFLRGDSAWEPMADRYDIDAFVIDKKTQPTFLEEVGRGTENWQVVLEDDVSLVLRRRDA